MRYAYLMCHWLHFVDACPRRNEGHDGRAEHPVGWGIPHTQVVTAVAAGVFVPIVGLSTLILAPVEIAPSLGCRRAVAS